MTSAVVVSQLAADADNVRLACSKSARLTDLVYSSASPTSDRIVRNEITGLDPDTQYFYTLEIDGALRVGNIGRFRTKPVDGNAFSFRTVFGSCVYSGSNSPVFDAMTAEEPFVLIHMGDMHYANIATDDEALFSAAYDEVLSSPRQARMFRRVPMLYMHDDHDFGPNNATGDSDSRNAAIANFRKRSPHPALVLSGDTDPVYYAVTVGRVRIIVTDIRSERTVESATDSSSKTMMGAAQKAWFKAELLGARDAGQAIVWASTSPWVATSGGDIWYGFSTERAEISQFFADNALTDRLCVLSGDRHSCGIDDGSNSGFASGGAGGVPAIMASPFDRDALDPLGTYSEGTYLGTGSNYGVMDITDEGGTTIGVSWQIKDFNAGTVPLSYEFSLAI